MAENLLSTESTHVSQGVGARQMSRGQPATDAGAARDVRKKTRAGGQSISCIVV
jgi:hypothetical protein